MTTDEIGASSDAFYSNPEYDRLFEEQTVVFDHAEERKAVIQEMIAILQEDVPYIVLTEDPYLEAYNSDSLEQRRALSARPRPGPPSASRSPTSRC